MGLAALGAAAVGWHTRSVLLRLCARRDGAPRAGPLPLQIAASSQTQRSWEGSRDGSGSPQLQCSARPFAVTFPRRPLPWDLPAAAAAVKPALFPGTFSNINSWPSRLHSCTSAWRQASTSQGSLHHPSPRGPGTWELGSGDCPGLGQTRCGGTRLPTPPHARELWCTATPATALAQHWSAKASSSTALGNLCL